jgi:hypothetical protein
LRESRPAAYDDTVDAFMGDVGGVVIAAADTV